MDAKFSNIQENERSWPKEAQKFVDSMLKRKIIYYIMLIVFSLGVAFVGRSCDSSNFYDSVIQYSSSPFLWVAFFPILIIVVAFTVYGFIKNSVDAMYSRVLMKKKLKRKLNIFDRALRVILIIVGIVSFVLYLMEFFGFLRYAEDGILHEINILIRSVDIIDMHTIWYAFIAGAVIAICCYPTFWLYRGYCSNCGMCNAFTIYSSEDKVVDVYATKSEEVSVAEVYDGATHVGTIKQTVGTDYVKKHKVDSTFVCQNCGAVKRESYRYDEKLK